MATREQIAAFARRLAGTRERLMRISPTYVAAVILPPLAVLALVLLLTFHFLQPLPPRTLTIAVGSLRGSYAQYAMGYRKVFQQAGIELKLVATDGASDTLERLAMPSHGIDAAILQDGIADPGMPGLVSIGAIGYEPIWVFYQSAHDWAQLSDLAGKRIAIGRWQAGTQPFAIELLREGGLDYNVEAFDPPGHNVRIATISGLEALEELKAHRLDAVVTLGEPNSPVVQAYFHTPGIKALPLVESDAISRHRPFLHRVTVPRGGIDLHTGVPERDFVTLATTSVVYARADLHPALVALLTSAMVEVHQEGNLLAAKHEFPSDIDESLPQHPVAARYIKNGPSLLMRYLPFWLATLLDRTLVVLVPLFALLLPASRVIPQIYAWRMRRRLDRWYAELKFLDAELDRSDASTDRGLLLDRIAWIEQQLAYLRLPLSFANQLYVLKEHLDLVRRRVLRVRRPGTPGGAPGAATDTAAPEPGVLAD